MASMMLPLLLTLLTGAASAAEASSFLRTTAIGNAGNVEAVYGILDRILPGERSKFTFVLNAADSSQAEGKVATVQATRLAGSDAAGFELEAAAGKVKITASGTNELAAGLGFYLREHCFCVIGWPRGGGSQISKPKGGWPDASVKKSRIVPWSYAMNVCTHSYSLVWYGWAEWEVSEPFHLLIDTPSCKIHTVQI